MFPYEIAKLPVTSQIFFPLRRRWSDVLKGEGERETQQSYSWSQREVSQCKLSPQRSRKIRCIRENKLRGEQTFLMKTRGERWLLFPLGSGTTCLLVGRLGALFNIFLWKQLPPLCRLRVLLLRRSRWDHQLWTPARWADGKAERLSWGFWLTTSNFLGWSQSTALFVLVGSAVLTDWTKAQVSKGQLLIYAQWAYSLVTTRTNTALQGQILLSDKHEVNNTECMSFRHFWSSTNAHAYTEKETLALTWHKTASIAQLCSTPALCLLHQMGEMFAATQSSPRDTVSENWVHTLTDSGMAPQNPSGKVAG